MKLIGIKEHVLTPASRTVRAHGIGHPKGGHPLSTEAVSKP